MDVLGHFKTGQSHLSLQVANMDLSRLRLSEPSSQCRGVALRGRRRGIAINPLGHRKEVVADKMLRRHKRARRYRRRRRRHSAFRAPP
jgi:hypothetical protein